MAISEKNPGNLASLFTFLFDKSPMYESHWIIFGRQVAKNSGKIFILKKKKRTLVCCLLQSPDKCLLSSNVYSYLSLVASLRGMCVGS
jgi:hypothetical protein